jgi:hypothetical protein
MNKKLPLSHAAFTLALLLPGIAGAAITYDEAVSGDFANADLASNGISPGTFAGIMSDSINTVTGTFGNSTAPVRDTDVFSFTIPTGFQLTAINLTYNEISGDARGGSYFGIQGGLDIGTGLDTVGSNLSNALVMESGNILADFAAGPEFGGTGLTAPLGAGNYTMFLSESAAVVGYRMDFAVSAVPEPESYAMMLAGLAMVSAMARRRIKTQAQYPESHSKDFV